MFDLVRDDPAAADLFQTAAGLLSRDARDLVCDATREELERNRTAQILCALRAVTLWRCLEASMPSARVVAGYSVGEAAAWGIAGVFGLSDVLRIVAARAEAMDAASQEPQGLIFVRGLPPSTIDEICNAAAAHVAIVNPGDAFVIGGSSAALAKVAKAAAAKNASRVAPIGVHVASHTPALAAAVEPFRRALRATRVADQLPPGVRLYSGIDGSGVFGVSDGLDKLAEQVAATVHWADCLQACKESGANRFLELGPGRVLSDMVSSSYRDARSRSAEEFRSLDGLRAWLQRDDR